MAGGVNPFGFSGGVIPQAVRPKRGPQDLPSAPFGFAPPPSKWEQTKDILAPYVTAPWNAMTGLMSADLDTLLYDTGPKGREAVENSFNLAGNLAGASSVVPKPRNALNMGIKAYHGSPHDFDRFDMSKIGTGEGAQAYGHGLYFADSEGVARSYRDNLSTYKLVQDYNNANPRNRPGQVAQWWTSGMELERMDDALKILEPQSSQSQRDEWIKAGQKLFDEMNSKGRMYEVSINADPDAFLDWDKPLSEQPEAVRKAFQDTYQVPGWKGDKVPLRDVVQQWETGGMDPLKMPEMRMSAPEAYTNLGSQIGGQPKASQALREAGIPGIKYLDAGSRGAGDGTRNYVVFDDKLVSIVRKYGIAGASAMLGYNILEGMDPAQAEELQRIEGNQ
jgi:hypothetical protein